MFVHERLKPMKKYDIAIILGLLTITSATAFGDSRCKFPTLPYDSREVLSCFHPEGGTVLYTEHKWSCYDPNDGGDENDAQLACTLCKAEIETGEATLDGTLHFAGAISKRHYQLGFQFQTKFVKNKNGGQLYSRIIPISDNAPFPVNQDCWAKEWKPWDIDN